MGDATPFAYASGDGPRRAHACIALRAGGRAAPARPAGIPRHLPGAGRDRHHQFGRRHGARRAGDGGAASRRRRSGAGHPGDLIRSPQGQPGGAAARHRRAAAAPPARPSRRGGSAARGLGLRSVQARRGGRPFPRPRRHRRQGDGGDLRRQPDPLRQGRVQARPRHHPGADRRRGAVGFAAQRRALAAGAPSRSDRCGIRHQRGRRRHLAQRRAVPFRRANGREGLPNLSARSDGSRRPQRGAAARQPDLSPRRGVAPARAVRFSAAAQCGDAGLFRAHGGDRDACDRRGDQGAARRPHRPRGVGATDRPPRLQRADPHHLRRHHARRPDTPKTRCRRPPAPP